MGVENSVSDVLSERAVKPDNKVFDAGEIFDGYSDAVVSIVAQGSSGGGRTAFAVGSGFFISADRDGKQCEIASVNHSVVPNSRLQLDSVEVTLQDGSKFDAKLHRQDLAHDLAYLTISGVENADKVCKVLKLAEETPEPGENIVRISRKPSPSDAAFHAGKYIETIDRSSLDLIHLDGEDPTRKLYKLELSNQREQAFGGSPILNESGEVVAVHAGGLSGSETLAVPVSDLKVTKPEGGA